MTDSIAAPDLILFNGDLRTQDPDHPRAEAAAIRAGRIAAVGKSQTLCALAGPGTRRLDLGKRLVLPGFIDAHFHFFEWALSRRYLALAGCKSLGQVLQMVRQRAKETAPGAWILGNGFNETDWPENRLPICSDLDSVAPDHPVALWRTDLHLAVANTTALAVAGIDSSTPNPPEGIIGRDVHGRPDGILRELAVNLIRKQIPQPGQEAIVAALKEAISEAHRMGLTAIHDVRLPGGTQGASALTSWQLLHQTGDLSLRCWVTLPGERLEQALALGLRTGFGDNRLRIGHVKYFADGGMGARTAWMIEPYLDGGSGMPLTPMAELFDAVKRADGAGLAVMIHAIGDRTNRELIGVFEKLREMKRGKAQSVKPAAPHRIEHVQMIRPPDIARLADLGVTACVQPHNLVIDIAMVDQCIAGLGRHTYPFRDLLDAGVALCIGSDCPVCDPRPLVNIHAAVNRCLPDATPSGGWYPGQRILVGEAVSAYTTAAAAAGGASGELGSITVGKRADIIALDTDIFSCDPLKISEANVVLNVFDGQIVFGPKF